MGCLLHPADYAAGPDVWKQALGSRFFEECYMAVTWDTKNDF